MHRHFQDARNYVYPYTTWDLTSKLNSHALLKIESLAEVFGITRGRVGTEDSGIGLVDEEKRRSDVSWIKETPVSQWLFTLLRAQLAEANARFWDMDLKGFNELQYAEYKGEDLGFCHAHQDYQIGLDCADSMFRKLSGSLILNSPDQWEGGEFQILDGDEWITVPQSPAQMIVFDSRTYHRITPVTKGIRKVIVVWGMGPKFR